MTAQPKGEKVYHEPRDGPKKPVSRPTNEELDAIEEEERREAEKKKREDGS